MSDDAARAPDPAFIATKRAMIRSASRVVLLADHTKVGNDYLARFGSLDDVDLLVTDNGLDSGVADELTAAGLAVERA